MDNITFTRLTTIALFIITYFSCISEIASFNSANFVFSNTLPIMWCQLFSVFLCFVFRTNNRKPILPIIFLFLLFEIKDLMYTAQNTKLLILYFIIIIITIILLLIYGKIDKKSNKQKIIHKV